MNIIKKFINYIFKSINCYDIDKEEYSIEKETRLNIENYDPKLYDLEKLNIILNKDIKK